MSPDIRIEIIVTPTENEEGKKPVHLLIEGHIPNQDQELEDLDTAIEAAANVAKNLT